MRILFFTTYIIFHTLMGASLVSAQTFFELIEEEKVEEIKALIEHDITIVELTAANESNNFPLHMAVQKCSAPIIEVILDAQADVNARNYYDHTPLHMAARYCPLEIIQLLVASGADINVKTKMDLFTPLHFAAKRKNDFDVIDYLIEAGIDINSATNVHKTTPVTQAISSGHKEMVEYLVEKGADLKIGYVLNKAIESGGTTIELFQFLIENGADINKGTPLAGAITYGKFDMAKLLVESGADLNKNAIMIAAASKGDVDFIKYLVEKGALIDQGDRTPLMTASQVGHQYVVKYLISQGADVNHKTKKNEITPLSLAIWQGHKEVAIVLIKNGASTNVISHAGLGNIEELSDLPLEELIDTKDESDRTPLFAAIIGEQKKAVEFLLEKGAFVNSRTKIQGISPLHTAVNTGNRDITRLLLDSGANVHQKMNDSLYWRSGYKAIDIARELNDEFMIKLLEEYMEKEMMTDE